MSPGTELLYVKGTDIIARKDSTEALVLNTKEELQKAAEAAKKADVTIVYVGTTLAVEREGRDRTSLGLPRNQEELIKTVLAVNPRTIVVLLNAGPLTIPEVKENAPAILEAWWAGEEGEMLLPMLFLEM